MRQQRSIAAADEFLVEFPFAMVAAGPVRAAVVRRR